MQIFGQYKPPPRLFLFQSDHDIIKLSYDLMAPISTLCSCWPTSQLHFLGFIGMILHEFLFKYGPGGADEFMQVLTVSGHTKNPHHRKQSIYWPKLTKFGSAHNASVHARTHTSLRGLHFQFWTEHRFSWGPRLIIINWVIHLPPSIKLVAAQYPSHLSRFSNNASSCPIISGGGKHLYI